jgi:hypothetical protein
MSISKRNHIFEALGVVKSRSSAPPAHTKRGKARRKHARTWPTNASACEARSLGLLLVLICVAVCRIDTDAGWFALIVA